MEEIMDIENLINFLNPYIIEIRKCAPFQYKGILYQSGLYVLVDNAVLYVFNLATKIDPSITFCFESNGTSIVPSSQTMEVFYKNSEIQYDISHTCNMVYNDPELHNDEKFMAMATAKASEGAGFYFINASIGSIMTTVFPGLPSIQKSDKIELKVFNIDTSKLLINYTIFKKKLGRTYDIYYKIINVNSPLRC
jgi:hypothetical protein